MWPFKTKTFLDADDEAWLCETWRWFLTQFGGVSDLQLSPLVSPTREFFPPTDRRGHERAERIFALVKQYARMDDWPCRLVAQPPRPELRVGEVSALKFESHAPLGTFGLDGNEVVITYDPAALDDAVLFIATMAHELAHYRLGMLSELPPGGGDMVEPATDLLTAYLGFGLFGANSAFSFRQHGDAFSQGWASSGQGYLSERHWCFALAAFFAVRSQPIDEARRFLKDHLYSDLRKAAAYLKRQPLSLLVHSYSDF
jgi:hypothetical protein